MSGSGSPREPSYRRSSAQRELGIQLLPAPPVRRLLPAVQTGNLRFLSGMLPTMGHEPQVVGCLGKELSGDAA
jgi:hypothetical protein